MGALAELQQRAQAGQGIRVLSIEVTGPTMILLTPGEPEPDPITAELALSNVRAFATKNVTGLHYVGVGEGEDHFGEFEMEHRAEIHQLMTECVDARVPREDVQQTIYEVIIKAHPTHNQVDSRLSAQEACEEVFFPEMDDIEGKRLLAQSQG